MKNREFFELRVTVNYGETVSLQVPFSVYEEFQQAISGCNKNSMDKKSNFFFKNNVNHFTVDMLRLIYQPASV